MHCALPCTFKHVQVREEPRPPYAEIPVIVGRVEQPGEVLPGVLQVLGNTAELADTLEKIANK